MSCEWLLIRTAKASLTLVFVWGLWQPVHAFDGKQLTALCDEKSNSFERGVCIGYITGVSESLTRVLQFSGICGPAGITTDQVGQVVAKYLHNHPETLNESAVNVVWSALVKAWPCPGMKSPQ